VPQRLPARVEPAEVQALLGAARSARDRALLTLLWRTGQRIGDWSEELVATACWACGWPTWTGRRARWWCA
jgi:integrase